MATAQGDRDPAHRAQFDACISGAMTAAVSTAKNADLQLAANK